MINKTFRRLALGAAAVTVAGVVVPVALAQSASAATTTTLSVAPTTDYTVTGGPASFAVTPTPALAAGQSIYYDIYSGPDASTAQPFLGTVCTAPVAPATAWTCGFTAGATPGTDHIHFFAAATGGATYSASDPSVDGTAVVAGAVNSVTIAPTTAHQAQGVYQNYQVTATDSGGRPVPGATITITATQSNATGGVAGDLSILTSGASTARSTAFYGVDTPSPAGTNGTATGTVTTGDGTAIGANAEPAGQGTVNVASKVTGTVAINASGGAGISSNATQTVDAGTANDVTTVTLTPTSQSVFVGDTVTEIATLKNAQGDLVGGVTPSGFVTGANTGATVGTTQTTGAGTSTLTYTASSAGSDTLTGYVNQTNHSVNTGGLDAGEPSGTASITVSSSLASPVLTNSCSGASTTGNPTHDGTCAVAASAGNQTVTFTLKSSVGGSSVPAAGRTLVFTTSAGYTVSPGSAVTDSNGQATVTVTDTAGTPASGSVTATFTNGSAGNVVDSPDVNFVTTTASALSVTPLSQTKVAGSQVTVTGTAKNALGAGVSGDVITFVVSNRNNVGNNLGATGTCTTDSTGSCNFTYTDQGPALTGATTGTDYINATDSATPPNTAPMTQAGGVAAATVTYVAAGEATAATVTLSPTSQGPIATTPAGKTGTTTAVTANVKNSNTQNLANDTVTFTSTGVGTFVNPTTGASLGTSTTVATDGSGNAKVYVASSTPGTQTVTASADGIQSGPASITYVNSAYNPVIPTRVADTRTGQGGISLYGSGSTAPTGPLAPNTLYDFDLSNTNAPLGAAAYVFNVTVIGPTSAGNLRIAPLVYCASNGVPTTSLVNFQPGKDVANSIVIPQQNVGCGYSDQFVIYLAGSAANVAIDLQGFYSSTNEFTGITPTRVADTRNSGGPVAANTSQVFQISGPAGLPAGAKAVALNVTAIGPTGQGNLRIYPDGASVPNTSNINYIPGVDKAAFVVVNLPADGKIDVYSAGSPVNVAIDVFGYYPSTATVVTQAPARVFDSRTGTELQAGTPVDVTVAGPGATGGANVPANAQAVLVSLTAIHAADSTGVGNLRAYPTGTTTPTVSNINYVGPNEDVANFAIVPIGANGQITLYSAGSNINAAVDILGYVPAAS